MLSGLLDEIEERLRQIIREEIKAALLELDNPTLKIASLTKLKINNAEPAKPFPQLLTAPEVAELLGVKTARVYELSRSSKSNGFPVIKIGERRMKFSRESLLVWLQSQTQI